ncbi:MAG: HTTM domain-containing protein [Bdellovibrionota bacterium]
MLSTLKASLKRALDLDLRSLAVCRIGLGFIVFLDSLFRLSNLQAHYTDFGVLPLNVLYKLYKPTGPCLHCLSSSYDWTIALFIAHAVFGLMLMIGWKTRFSILASWLLTVSVQFRNPLVIDGGDVLLRCYLLWMLVLPVSERFSIDSRKNKNPSTNNLSYFNLALPLQCFLLYFMSALFKTGADWWPLGTATGYALSLDAFVTPLANG